MEGRPAPHRLRPSHHSLTESTTQPTNPATQAIHPFAAAALLRHNHWNKEQVIDSFCTDPDKVRVNQIEVNR